jgi:hypothetical protein
VPIADKPAPDALEICRRLRAVAQKLELGQADTPLVRHADALAVAADRTVTVLLLSLTPQVRSTTLSWLVGPQHQSISVRLSKPADVLEVLLQERGYSLETAEAGVLHFDNADAFARALDSAQAAAIECRGAVRLALSAPTPLCSLRLLVVLGPRTVATSAREIAKLCRDAPILLVAAPADHVPTQEDRDALQALALQANVIWPVVVSDEPTPLPEWARRLPMLSAAALLPTRLVDGNAMVPEFIVQGPSHPLRLAMAALVRAQRVASLADMVTDRCETDQRQLQARQRREARADASEGDPKPALDRARDAIAQTMTRLAQVLKERARQAVLPSAPLGDEIARLQSSLQAGDLDREPAGKVVRLVLKPGVGDDFRRRVGRQLRHRLDEECVLVRDALEELRQSVEQGMAQAGMSTIGLPLAAPDNEALWAPLADVLRLDIRYRGEVARRGFLQRLGEGRKVVFVALMALSLVGSFVGFNVRQAAFAGVFFLLLFVGAVVYTYRTWRDDDVIHLDREIERVRDSVAAELARVVGDAQRERQARWQQFLDDAKRDALARIDAVLRESLARQAQAAEAQRREGRANGKLVEQRLKDFQSMVAQTDELRRACAQAVEAGMAGLQAAVALERTQEAAS